MRLEKIKVSNFKCFKDVSINLDKFNVVIGKNASGKSNIVNIIKFIKDMLIYGIDEAIDLQGGINYLYNSDIKANEPISINFVMNVYDDDTYRRMQIIYRDSNVMMEKYEIKLVIQPHKQGNGYKIINHSAIIRYIRLEQSKKNKGYGEKLDYYEKKERIIHRCQLKDNKIIERFSNNISDELKKRLKLRKEIILSKYENDEKLLLVNYIPIFYYFQSTRGENIKIYDFNPKNLKSASIINKQNILEEDGSNIANVIQRILKDSHEKKSLLLMLKKLMPFIEDISTEKSFNKSMYFKVRENNKNDLPSVLLSDGTVNIIAIIVALYFEKNNDIVIIEEPEKNIHPKLASQLVSIMKSVGNRKQIIITTHNAQLLSCVDLKDIIYVYRNREMYSDIEIPNNNNKVKEFIKNELEIGDLFYEGLFTEKEI